MKPIDRLRSLFLEASGSLGDLGTFLPYVIGAISINHLSPSSVFGTFGLFYISSGLFYRMPMAVQPMKAASAYALSYDLTSDAIAAASVAIGVVLVVLWATGAIKWLVKHAPGSVSIGIQVDLGISLTLLGIKFIMQQPLGIFFLFTGLLFGESGLELLKIISCSGFCPGDLGELWCKISIDLENEFSVDSAKYRV